MEFIKIMMVGLVAAVGYGVVHDQVTTRVCLEYFTIGHPRIIASNSATLLGLVWGVAATWWVGLPLGLLLALAARSGSRPKLAVVQVTPLVAVLLGTMAGLAALAGLSGYLLASNGYIVLHGQWARSVPVAVHPRFLADLWAHNASYLSGICGAVLIAAIAYRKRARLGAKAA